MTVNFNLITDADAELIFSFSARAAALYRRADGAAPDTRSPRLLAEMDLIAVHVSGCPLDLAALAAADDANFAHDILGIRRHLDRDTGRLGGCFTPRFARREA